MVWGYPHFGKSPYELNRIIQCQQPPGQSSGYDWSMGVWIPWCSSGLVRDLKLLKTIVETRTLRLNRRMLFAIGWGKPLKQSINSRLSCWCISAQMLCVWNIYLHLPQKSPSYVGKYSSTMEHLGWVKYEPLVCQAASTCFWMVNHILSRS